MLTIHTPAPEVASAPDRLRLLHIGPLPPPWSGIGSFLQAFLASAPVSAQANWVLDTSRGVIPGSPRRAKLPTPGRITRHAGLAWRVMQTVRQNRIQVVHLHGSSHDLSFFGNWLSVLAAKLGGGRVVWHLHEDLAAVMFPGRNAATRTIFAALARSADALALLTEKDARIASALVPVQKASVISVTCDPEFSTLDLQRPDGALRVLFVGWLTPAKGIFDLLRVALAVRERRPDITFDVLGIGMSADENDAVSAFVEQHQLARQVTLHGVVTGDAKRHMFAEANLLFMPTRWDAFPVAILEAMAAGLPVVGTRVGGLPSMLEGERGAFLAAVGDIPEMSGYLTRLAGDPGLRLRMGRANRERFLSCYHPDRVGQTAVDLYRHLAGERH